jgi:hypothetical protein
MQAMVSSNLQPKQSMNPEFTYGQTQSIDSILGTGSSTSSGSSDALATGYAEGGLATPMFKAGGLPTVMAHGKERIDFRQGMHVEGPGDGQSDDIPAMLADGEFVFSADVVSALGNGSTKAGSDMLYKMVEEIRKRARSTHPKNLPPPAKSPLDYLKSMKPTKARS